MATCRCSSIRLGRILSPKPEILKIFPWSSAPTGSNTLNLRQARPSFYLLNKAPSSASNDVRSLHGIWDSGKTLQFRLV
ncbi:hypothetical protein HPP92_028880 [Vanilla planifolia]|uniref:Uncharacterized protein n=1 Tax=Vanilla planifolia TaxID=51239 RepID=A0A835P9B3_VANPL|nr:hypothetical protein HPP92_028880 [Vanilla planifolia]KAG0446367.1 hypothetical protein HPP92_028869 [Vanilla planifolia]